MRILIVDTDYGAFLGDFYSRHPGLADASYDEQVAARRQELFGIAHSYATHLGRLGHETAAICPNNAHAQRAWAREHGRRRLPPLAGLEAIAEGASRRLRRGRPWLEEVLVAQVRAFRPDVLVCLSIVAVDPLLISEVRDTVGLVVGQHAATPLPNIDRLGCYDLLVSSYPPTVEALRTCGLTAEHLRLAFDPDVLAHVPDERVVHDVAFVGNLYEGVHNSRVVLLERLCEHFGGMGIWTASVDELPEASTIRRRYAGSAWGIDMYQVFRSSRIVVNHHGDFSQYANNSRLFEATGCGALLVTDAKANLPEMFVVGTELLAYEDVDECIELIERHLADESACAAVALAGQSRTLRDHTYDLRMRELLDLAASKLPPSRVAHG